MAEESQNVEQCRGARSHARARECLGAGAAVCVFDIDVGSKAAVVRLSDGSLWIHSPIELDADTKAAVDELGLVKHIVSPNYEHVKFARQWIEAYPDATSYVCPGGKAKFPAIPYDREIGNEAPAEWLGEVAHPPPLPPPHFSPLWNIRRVG